MNDDVKYVIGRNKKERLLSMSVCLGFFALIFIVGYIKNEETAKHLENYGLDTVVTVFHRNIGNAKLIFYDKDNNKYKIVRDKVSLSKPVIIGDKYKISYASDNPAKYHVFHGDQPVFLNHEEVAITDGKIIYLSKGTDPGLTFIYSVNDTLLKRSQDFEKISDSIKEGDKFKVKYWLKDPRRSVIYLDKPVKQ